MEVSVYFLVILKENLILSGKWQSCGFHATSSGWWGALDHRSIAQGGCAGDWATCAHPFAVAGGREPDPGARNMKGLLPLLSDCCSSRSSRYPGHGLARDFATAAASCIDREVIRTGRPDAGGPQPGVAENTRHARLPVQAGTAVTMLARRFRLSRRERAG
jgi:hypothetical protein